MQTRFRRVRALVTVVLMAAALSSLAGTAAAEKLAVNLEPAHGPPGVSVTVNVTMATIKPDPESATGEPLPQATGNPTCEAFWDDDPEPVVTSQCDVDINAGIFWSDSFTVSEDATEGAHRVEVHYGLTRAGTTLEPVNFTVDAAVVTTTSPEPPPDTATGSTGDPADSADVSASTIVAAPPDETISTTNADASTGGPPGIAVIMAALALIAAGILSWMIRGLRQRSSRWVSQHVRVVTATRPPRIVESGSRRRRAISIRLEIHGNEPRQEHPRL
jgi:hypothetical protein